MDRAVWTSAAIGFLAPVVMFSPLNASQAWFSAWQKPLKPAAAASAAPSPAPVEAHAVRTAKIIRVRHGKAVDKDRGRSRLAGKPIAIAEAPVAKPIDPKEQLARTIDPGKRPDWYLIDPTLKRGDVLFLADKVVVFRGRKIGNLADYVPVARTRMLSRKDRRLIERMASRPAPSLAETPPARPNRLADASSAGTPAAN
ncbi:hypothetical protein [Methylopila sp. M107]|uniref:hypothetical protein n=1 Tax=Methylopila sp. M107 TaxID=1101190 RepID=UPI000374283B|nr:hypothetical protein [Methylopila sp. M107]